jgi:hypothetical protein
MNKLNPKGQAFSVDEVARQRRYCTSKCSQLCQKTTSDKAESVMARWDRPPNYTVKLNIDGSYA